MMRKHCFNMIEIILAISIIAIGISSVMALFVSGIRTGQSTVASSNMPDVSESLLNHIRAQIDECCDVNGWNTSKLDKVAPSSPVDGAGNFSSDLLESSDGNVIKGDDKGAFLYRQLSVSAVDNTGKPTSYVPTFSAVALVQRTDNSFGDIVLSHPGDFEAGQFSKKSELKDSEAKSGTDLMNKFRIIVRVTLSYPADAPAETRETRTYVMEFFNHKYNRFSMEGENAAPTP